MIIQRSFFSRFSPAIQEAIALEGDDKLIIPSIFFLAGLPPEPFRITSAISDQIQNSSFSSNVGLTVANGVTQTFIHGLLSTGYWRIVTIMTYSSNYVGTPGVVDAQVRLFEGAVFMPLANMFAQVSGSQNFTSMVEVMMSSRPIIGSTGSLSTSLTLNGAGQSHSVNVSVICSKLL